MSTNDWASWEVVAVFTHPYGAAFSANPEIIGDPVERAGLGLEAGNVFLLPIWIGAYDMPLNPKLAGLWSEPEFAYGLSHSGICAGFRKVAIPGLGPP